MPATFGDNGVVGTPDDLSRHLSACDLFVQRYIDGVSGRRTSLMAGDSGAEDREITCAF
jgi:hypothetical protein